MTDPIRDLNYPSEFITISLNQNGSEIYGNLYIPQGKGPHPLILLINGFPEHDKNSDIAHALKYSGFCVANFAFRGSCGAQGEFSYQNCIEDVNFLLNFFYNSSKEFQQNYRFNPDKIHLIGHSFGGFLVLYCSFQTKIPLQSVISISSANIGLAGELLEKKPEFIPLIIKNFESKVLLPLNIKSIQSLIDEMIQNQKNWNLIHFSENSLKVKTLCFGALQDSSNKIDLHHIPLAKHFSINPLFQEKLFDTDHFYSDKRNLLIQEIINFLTN